VKCSHLFLLWTPNELDDFTSIATTLLTNILNNPYVQKYKEIKLQNSTVQSRIVSRNGGIDFLYAAGFESVNREDTKMLVFQDHYIPTLESTIEWLRVTVDMCKSAQPNPVMPCAVCEVQIRFPNGATVRGGFFGESHIEEVLFFARVFFVEEKRSCVTLHLPHSADVVDPMRTLESYGLAPRGTLIASTLSAQERVSTFCQNQQVATSKAVQCRDVEKKARVERLAKRAALENDKRNVLRAFKEDRERHKKN